MTLSEFSNKCFSICNYCETIVVDWEPEPSDFDNLDNLERLFTLRSAYESTYYLKEEFANAEVQEIYALGRDKFLVWVKIADKVCDAKMDE